MRASRNNFSRRAFVLNEVDVDALADIFSRVGHVEVSIDSSDGLSRHFESIDELKHFDNAPTRAIRALELSARDNDKTIFARLSLRNADGDNVVVMIEGTIESTSALSENLEARLAGMRPWYSSFARMNEVVLVLACTFLFGVGLMILSAKGILRTDSESTDSSSTNGKGDWAFVGLVVMGPVIIMGFYRARNRFFPVGTFAIGMGRGRYNQQENFRLAIFIGLVISVVGGIIAALVV